MEIFYLFGFFGLLVLYFVPSVVASRRNHPNLGTISLLNIFTGWTGIGWLVVMVWAFRD